MSIERIMALMPVPEKPVEAEGHDWSRIPEKFGVKALPTDYMTFVATFGSGSIGDFLWVMNPFSENQNLNTGMSRYLRDSYDFMKQEFPKDYRRDSGTFVPWALTDNGDSLIWISCEKDPDEWHVVIQNKDQSEEEITNLTTSEFLIAVLDKSLDSKILPSEWLALDKPFKPIKK